MVELLALKAKQLRLGLNLGLNVLAVDENCGGPSWLKNLPWFFILKSN